MNHSILNEATPKQKVIDDLYRLMYCVPMSADPDSWDLVVGLAKAVINHHALPYMDKEDIADSNCWGEDYDTMNKFFDECCPGVVPTQTQFEYLCGIYFDWTHWEAVRAAKEGMKGFDLFETLLGVRQPEPRFTVIATAEQKDNITLVTPISEPNKAA